MSLAEAAAPNLPTSRRSKPDKPQRIEGKVKAVIERMVELGEPWNDAARACNMSARSMRKALDKPHVIAYLKARREVFRSSVNAANIHRLAQIRDAADNMPAVNAVRLLEQMDNEPQSRSGHAQLPGLVIQVITHSGETRVMEHHPQNEAKPLIEHAPVRMERDE